MTDFTQTFLVGCCWREGMPEPKGIRCGLRNPRRFHEVDSRTLSCDFLDRLQGPAVLIWDSRLPFPHETLAACPNGLSAVLYNSPEGRPVFHAASLPAVGARPATPR